MGYNRQLKWALSPSNTTSSCDNHTSSDLFLDQLGSLMILTFSYFFSLPSLSLMMSLHPGSWLRFAATLAAVFTFFTVFLLKVSTCVRSVFQYNHHSLLPANKIQYNRCEVESMKASLLGCGPEQQASRKDEMGTEEKCMYEYNLTLSFEATMGRSVLTMQTL